MFLAPHVLVNAGLILSVPRRALSSSEPEKKEKVPAGLSSVACRLSDRGFRQLIQSFRRAQKSGWLPVGTAGCFRSESVDDLPGIRRYAGGCKSDLFLELYSFSTTEDRNRSRSSYKGILAMSEKSVEARIPVLLPKAVRPLSQWKRISCSCSWRWGVRQRLSVSSLQRLEANLGIEPEQSRPKTGAHQ